MSYILRRIYFGHIKYSTYPWTCSRQIETIFCRSIWISQDMNLLLKNSITKNFMINITSHWLILKHPEWILNTGFIRSIPILNTKRVQQLMISWLFSMDKIPHNIFKFNQTNLRFSFRHTFVSICWKRHLFRHTETNLSNFNLVDHWLLLFMEKDI